MLRDFTPDLHIVPHVHPDTLGHLLLLSGTAIWAARHPATTTVAAERAADHGAVVPGCHRTSIAAFVLVVLEEAIVSRFAVADLVPGGRVEPQDRILLPVEDIFDPRLTDLMLV